MLQAMMFVTDGCWQRYCPFLHSEPTGAGHSLRPAGCVLLFPSSSEGLSLGRWRHCGRTHSWWQVAGENPASGQPRYRVRVRRVLWNARTVVCSPCGLCPTGRWPHHNSGVHLNRAPCPNIGRPSGGAVHLSLYRCVLTLYCLSRKRR